MGATPTMSKRGIRMNKEQIVYKKTSELQLNARNPRKNDEAVDTVARSIQEFGFKNPLIVDSAGTVWCGNTRLKAARKLGIKEVPCIVADDLTEEQIRKLAIIDNKSSEIAEWDLELLSEELAELDFSDWNLEWEVGGEKQEKEVVEDDFDVDEAIPEEPNAKLGDIYQLGEHRLMCGDSTKEEDVAKLMNGVKADMVFTDPPWNVDYSGASHPSLKQRSIMNDSMSTDEFKDFMLTTFKCMNKFSKEGCMTYVVMSAQEWGNMMLTLSINNYHWSSTIIWNKDHLVFSRKDYHTKYEPIWYGWKDGASRLCPLSDRTQSDVWDFDRPTKSDEHPTMKPVSLVAKAITNSSKNGNIILDLFGGSGTTLLASEQTGRSCYMMELDPKYVDVIIKRWEDFTGKKAVKIN